MDRVLSSFHKHFQYQLLHDAAPDVRNVVCLSLGMKRFSYIQHFNFQLTHTTLKKVELLKHFKISKTAPTCFGLQGNHHQGATVST